MAKLAPLVKAQFFDINGNPLALGKVYTNITNTSTPKTTYSDAAGTPNTNPIILNSRGEADIWIDSDVAYRFIIKDASDVTIWTKDNVGVTDLGTSSGAASVGYLQYTTTIPTTVQEKLRQTGIISANADGGCIGDASTDNQTGLYLLRDFMRLNPRPWTLNFDPNSGSGVYHFSKNQWCKGINDLTINAEGCTFKCTSGSGNSFDKYPFTGNQGVFNNSGYDTYSSGSTLFGYKINSSDAGAPTVTTSTAGDSANFALGNKVLIYGFGQQDASFPPNPRYFEFNEVVSQVGGVVTLKNPLKNSYNSAWHDFSAGKGAPRIHNLSRSATDFTFCKRLIVNGGYWAPNTIDPTAKSFQVEGYESVILNDVKADNFVPSIVRQIKVNNCDFAAAEFDKIISIISLDGGRVQNLSAATGVELLEFKGNVLVQGTIDIWPRVLVFDGVIFDSIRSAASTFSLGLSANYPTDLVDFRSARFNIKDSTVVALVNGGLETTFLVDSAPSNTKVLVLCSNEAAFETLYQRMKEGYTYRLQDGSKQVLIKKIYDEDSTHAAIEGEFTAVPIAAETYRGASIERIRGFKNITQSGPYAPVKRVIFARHQNHENGEPRDYTEIDIPRQASASAATGIDIIIRARVTRIVVSVNKVYSGVDVTNQILVSKQLPAAAVNYAIVDGLTAGTRTLLPVGTTGSVGADTLTATAGDYVDTLRLTLRKSAGGFYPTYADPTDLPKFSILVETLKT